MHNIDLINLKCDSIDCNHELSNELFLFFYVNKYFKLYDFHNALKLKDILLFIPNILLFFLFSFIIPFSLLFNFSKGLVINNSKTLYVKRSQSSYKKIKELIPDDTFILDANISFFSKDNNNLFSQSLSFRFYVLLITPFVCFKYLLILFIFVKKHLFFTDIFEITNFYKIRIIHFVIYKYYLENFISNSDIDLYYTTNKECRFAGLDIALCKKYDFCSICIPHGLEYSFKLPLGYPCNKFFCLSNNSKKLFSVLYNDKNKFKFDKKLVQTIYSYRTDFFDIKRKVIFFTEPRGIFINKIIISGLLESDINFFVHLHPRDSYSNYSEFPCEIFDIHENNPLVGNIVLARKSTVLLEALYNYSISVSTLIHANDKNSFVLFPSLHSKLIYNVYDMQSLVSLIKKLLNESL